MRRRNSTLSLLLGVAIAISSAPLAAFAAPDAAPEPPKRSDSERPDGEAAGLIVRYKPGTLPTQGGEVTGAEGLELQVSAGDNIGRGLRTVEFDEVQSADAAREAAEQLEQSPLVLEAYPNFIYRLSETIETAEGPYLTTLPTTQTSTPWGLGRIDQTTGTLDYKYTYDTTGEGVTAYIVDSGIRTTHTQFTGRLAEGFKLPRFSSTSDCNGHGTHVAGTVGGTTYGVAKKVTLVPVRVFGCGYDSDPDTTTADLELAINWIIADHESGEPAVVNMSLGGPLDYFINGLVQQMINDGMTVVVSSGNEGDLSCFVSPASAENAITVNASTKSNNDASYSNFGRCSDIYAPGSEVKSADSDSNTDTAVLSGTSMASPHVAGVVARMLSYEPDLTPAEVTSRLIAEASPFDPGLNADVAYYCSFYPWDSFCYWGADDPELMLYASKLPVMTAPNPTISGSTVGLSTLTASVGSWTQTSPEPDVEPDLTYQWKRSGAVIPDATGLEYTLTPADVGKTITFTVTGNAQGYSTLAKTSAATATVTKPALSAPQTLSAGALPGAVALEWTEPASIGGTISDYVIQYRSIASTTYLTFNDGVSTDLDTTLTGLRFGSSYYVKVAAKTEFGTGTFTPAALVKTQTGLPTAPTGVTTTPAPRSIQLDWTAPATLNGGTISDYVIRYRVTGTTTWKTFSDGESTATTATVTGLSGSRSYEFAIQAKTEFGVGTSAVTKRSTLSGLASLPTSLVATPTRTTMELTWNAPSTTNGGGDVTDYVIKYRRTGGTTWVVFNDGETSATGVTISGLTRGISYEFAVAAKTQFGTASSAIVKRTTLTGVAPAPTNIVATPELTAMNLSWTAPSTTNDGGDVIDYVVRYRATGSTTWITFNDGPSTLTEAGVTGLTRNKSYEFVVAAKTLYGTGPSILVKRSTLSGTAALPVSLLAGPTAHTIELTWVEPASNGGTITDYIVRYRAAGTTTWITFADGVSTTNTATITGLTRNKAYDVSVYARTLAGSTVLAGPSATRRVSTLSGAPSVPLLSLEGAGTQSLQVGVSAEADPAYPITSYTVQFRLKDTTVWYDVPQSLSGEDGEVVITGLAEGQQFEVRASATSAAGSSAFSAILTGMTVAP